LTTQGKEYMQIIVVGAGAAGLAATYALRKRGIRVTALEAGAEAGGRCRTPETRLPVVNTGLKEEDFSVQALRKAGR
jgi:uncharacterized protein with NAD-binding domain and iron-sulfur cluster